MLRRLSRLLIIALLLAVVAFVASRLMGGDDDDDFDDFDDLDSGFDFQETPVEIDVPAREDTASAASTAPSAPAQTETQAPPARSRHTAELVMPAETSSTNGNGNAHTAETDEARLIDINGIGPAYEARLQAIGISNIGDLANADAETLAQQIEVIGGAATISEWITQAKTHNSDGQS
jgi:predicted flap endonuclease-1-like 5' DNA nuclease